MTKISLFPVMLTSALLLGACTFTSAPTTTEEVTERPTTTLAGKVGQAGNRYSLITETKIVEINSTKIKLDKYLGKNVEITGEFSGTTLYVDSIK